MKMNEDQCRTDLQTHLMQLVVKRLSSFLLCCVISVVSGEMAYSILVGSTCDFVILDIFVPSSGRYVLSGATWCQIRTNRLYLLPYGLL